MPPAKKMKIRTIVTSAVASVAVVGAVLLPVMLRGKTTRQRASLPIHPRS